MEKIRRLEEDAAALQKENAEFFGYTAEDRRRDMKRKIKRKAKGIFRGIFRMKIREKR